MDYFLTNRSIYDSISNDCLTYYLPSIYSFDRQTSSPNYYHKLLHLLFILLHLFSSNFIWFTFFIITFLYFCFVFHQTYHHIALLIAWFIMALLAYLFLFLQVDLHQIDDSLNILSKLFFWVIFLYPIDGLFILYILSCIAFGANLSFSQTFPSWNKKT